MSARRKRRTAKGQPVARRMEAPHVVMFPPSRFACERCRGEMDLEEAAPLFNPARAVHFNAGAEEFLRAHKGCEEVGA
jgi:hypothetical protein